MNAGEITGGEWMEVSDGDSNGSAEGSNFIIKAQIYFFLIFFFFLRQNHLLPDLLHSYFAKLRRIWTGSKLFKRRRFPLLKLKIHLIENCIEFSISFLSRRIKNKLFIQFRQLGIHVFAKKKKK